MPKPRSKDPYVVSDATCKGCIYYAPLAQSSISSMWFCSYALDTGKCRPRGESCVDCSVKVKKNISRSRRRVDIHIDKTAESQERMQAWRKQKREEGFDPDFFDREIINTETQTLENMKEGKRIL